MELDEAKFAKMNLYKVTEKNGKEKLARLKPNKTSLVSLDEGEYAVEIVSADKGKGKKNTGYGISIELPDLDFWRQETAIALMSDTECGLTKEDERMSRILIA